MLTKEQCAQLEKSAMERINKLYSDDNSGSLVKTISHAAVKSTIITLQEYEKINSSQFE